MGMTYTIDIMSLTLLLIHGQSQTPITTSYRRLSCKTMIKEI